MATDRNEPPPGDGDDKMGGHVSRVGMVTLASRVLGFLRDWCMAVFFTEARWVSDAFLTAFAAPNLFRNLLGEGALSAAFLPAFVDERENNGDESAARLAGQSLGLLAAVAGGIAAAAMILLLAANAIFSPEAPLSLTLKLGAVLFPFMPLVCLAALLATMLQGMHRFLFPAALSILLNIAFLAGFAWIYWGMADGGLGRLDGPGAVSAAYVLAAAVLVSGAAQVVLAWGRLAALGLRIRLRLGRGHPGVGRVLKVFVPAALGIGVVQANVFIDMIIAYVLSLSAPGAKTYLYLGNQLMHLPLALFGTAVASTAFPYFARHVARGDRAGLAARLGRSLRMALLWTVPAGLGLAVLADPVARLLYQSPDLAFSHAAVYRTALSTSFYALGLPLFAAQMLLVRFLYAQGDYRSPVRVAVWMVGLNLCLNLTLIHAPDFLRLWTPSFPAAGWLQAADVPLWRGNYAAAFGLADGDFVWGARLGEAGLALATGLTALVHVVLLWRVARDCFLKVGGGESLALWGTEARRIFGSAWRIVLAGLGMALLAHWFANSIPYEPEFPMRLERALTPMALGVAAYFGMGLIVPVPEIEAVFGRLARRLRK